MPPRVTAPFTDEQVKKLNEYQKLGFVHEFTCGGEHCNRGERDDNGALVATAEGWICPCGKYKQNWAHEFMTRPEEIKKLDFKL